MRTRTALVASTALACLVLIGCTPAENTLPEPDPTTPAPTETTPPPVGDDTIALPSCDLAFSDQQLDEFNLEGLVLNPPLDITEDAVAAGDELEALVSGWDATSCVWTYPNPTDFLIVVSYAEITEAEQNEAIGILEASGFTPRSLVGERAFDLNIAPGGPDDMLGAGYSESHFFGKGVWIGSMSWSEERAELVLTDTVEFLDR